MPALTSFPGLTQTQINTLIAAYAAPSSHNHAASAITSGLLLLARGGTGADLAATGGATHFLRQASVGAALTVGGIVSADLTTALTTPPAIGGTTPNTGAFTAGAFTITDAVLNSVTNVLDIVHLSTGTPTTNFGTGIRFRGHSATVANGVREMGGLRYSWITAPDASRASIAVISAVAAGVESDVITLAPSNMGLRGSGDFVFQHALSGDNLYIAAVVDTQGGFRSTGSFHVLIDTNNNQTDRVFTVRSNSAAFAGGNELLKIEETGKATLTLTTAGSLSSVVNTAVIGRNDTGDPLAGFGSGLALTLKSSTTPDTSIGSIDWLWNVATHGSRAPDMVFNLTDSAATREIMRMRANGSAGAIGFFGATPIARPTLAANATDLATAITLVNDIKAKLSAAASGLGLVA